MTKPKEVNCLEEICAQSQNQTYLLPNKNGIFTAPNKKLSKLLLLLAFVILNATLILAQNVDIQGKVISAEDGSALIGANILEKGTTNGTTTDARGNFKLKVNSGAVLVVSYVGYLKEEVSILNQRNFNITLKVDPKQMDDVVVVGIGYGEVKKSDMTGSVTAISAKDFSKGTITSAQELLIGKAPGVVANTLGGAAGAGTKIRIRGGSSIKGNNDPLIIIDNIPLDISGISGMANPLSSLNPNDIESFTILKDASATAIYGSRASNGVIIIKTKRGFFSKGLLESPKMSVNYSSNVTYSTPGKLLSVFTGDEFRELVKDRVENHGLTNTTLALLGTANTNWQDEIYQNPISTENNLSISHAIAEVPYRLSLGYLNQNGILKYNNMDRKNLALAITPSLLDGDLVMDINGSLTMIKNNFSNNDAIGSAIEFDPTQAIKNGNTRYGGYTAWTELSSGDKLNGLPNNIATHNPVARLEFRDNTSEAKRYILGGKFDYKIPFMPQLKATLNLGYDYFKTEGTDITSLPVFSVTTP